MLLLSTFLALSLGLPTVVVQDAPASPQVPATAQEEAPAAETEPADEPEEVPEPDPGQVPASLEEALALEPSDLAKAAEAFDAERLRELLSGWMEFVDASQSAFLQASRAPEGSEESKAETSLGTDRDAMIARAEIVISELAKKGGDVEKARARINGIREAEARSLDRISTVPSDQAMAQELELEVLKAQLRPLTKSQVDEQLKLWMALLQKKCLEVRKVEVAALESEDVKEIADFNERAVELRGERSRLIERVDVVVNALDRKKGNVDDARAYLKSVVVAPPVTGWTAAMTTLRAWVVNPDGGLQLARNIGVALLILMVFYVVGRFIANLVGRALKSMRKASELLREFVVGSVRKVVMFLGVLVALDQMGADLAPLLAAIGAAGLVVGLALQGTLSNLASGMLIMFYRPFDVGDTIAAAGKNGVVEGMTLFTTRIKTFDNQSMLVPNNMIWGDVITNVTANRTRRVDMTFGIGYGDDIGRAREVLMDVVRAHDKVLATPEPVIEVSSLGESSVNFIVRPWVETKDYWAVFWGLTRAVKERFDEEGISIPFPQRDLHVHAAGKDFTLQARARATAPEGEEAKAGTKV